MSRGGRTVVAVLLGGACLFSSAEVVTATRTRAGETPPDVSVMAADVVGPLEFPTTTLPLPPPPPAPGPTDPLSWFKPSGRNQGTEGLVSALAELALKDNAPLYVSETWGRATGGANSDHHVSRTDSWALDVAVRGIQQPTMWTETAAKRIGAALGEPGWTGGDMTKTINGYRFQVLWKVAGHYNHVHVGVRKVG
jgi:hypothetical protein